MMEENGRERRRGVRPDTRACRPMERSLTRQQHRTPARCADGVPSGEPASDHHLFLSPFSNKEEREGG